MLLAVATGGIVGLAKVIIDDTCLVCAAFNFVSWKHLEGFLRSKILILFLFHTENTELEIKKKIQTWISHKMKQGQMDEIAAMEAFRLNIILTCQLKVTQEDQLVSHSIGSIRQNLPVPENLTPLHVVMLGEIFGVREEKRRPPVVSCLGRGYDLIHDEIKARNIFDFSDDYSDAEYGLEVPKSVVLNVARQTSTFMEDFQNEEEYIRRRLSDLQVSLDLVDTNIFNMKNRGGFTRSKDRSGKQKIQQYSYLLEKRLFQLTLADLAHKSLLNFSQSFERSLKSIPKKYDKTDIRTIRDIQDFFNNWGQYVVVQAYAGGSMEVQLSTVHSEESDGISNLIEARIKISGMLHSLATATPKTSYEAGMIGNNSVTEKESFSMASSSVNWKGGSTDLQVKSKF